MGGKRTKYQDLNVSVSYRRGKHSQRHDFQLDAGKLPQLLCIEGLRVTVEEKENTRSSGQAEPNPDRIASRAARGKKQVEITLPDLLSADRPTWKKYNLIPVPREARTFFPKYNQEFVLRTPRGAFVVAISSARKEETDPYRGGYISKGMSDFHKAHSDLQPGDVLIFTKDGKGQVGGKTLPIYKMTVKTAA